MSSTVLHPLIVRVQTVDSRSLDFKTGGTGASKPRNVTCMEASNVYVFVGVASGTVYVFTRDKLSFKFMIPFKGGKVCHIVYSENERDLAIGSVRGGVGLYQIERNSDESNSGAQKRTTELAVPFKHIATIDLHKGNKITELYWSLNGRYLFVADNQGLISQADVGSWEEFPRPASFSRIILKLKSRIIQMNCLFPYLAVCTVSAVFLCDIENEDFIRIQTSGKQDIQASGVALFLSDAGVGTNSVAVHLYVSEMSSPLLHCYTLQGQLIQTKKIEMDSFLTRSPVQVFDPVGAGSVVKKDNEASATNVTLGKLLLNDDNLLISVSHNHVYFIEPKGKKMILWTDEFQKIHNAKLISNYAFLWSGTKVHVLSLTHVSSYSEQLFASGVMDSFDRWIQHCLCSFGWKEDQEADHETVAKYFRAVMHDHSSWNEESEFYKAVAARVPFDVSRSADDKSPSSLIWKPFKELLVQFDKPKALPTEVQTIMCSSQWEALQRFYSSIKSLSVPQAKSQPTLTRVMLNIEKFDNQLNQLNLYDELKALSLKDTQVMEEKIMEFLKVLMDEAVECLSRPASLGLGEFKFFGPFVDQELVLQWFESFEIPNSKVYHDAQLTDFLLVLIPLLSRDKAAKVMSGLNKKFSGFCLWLLTSTFYNFTLSSSYVLQLKSMFNYSPHFKPHAKDILSSIYRDICHFNLEPIYNSLHHIIGILYFITDDEDEVLQETVSSRREAIISLLISSFPFKHWPKTEIEEKLITLCHKNDMLFKMFKCACLDHQKGIQVCKCGIPIDCYEMPIQLLKKEEAANILIWKTTEGVILEILFQRHYPFIRHREILEKDITESFTYNFAMKSRLFEEFLAEFSHNLSDTFILELVLRVSSCALLEKVPWRKSMLKVLLRKREHILMNRTCETCGDPLQLPEDFKSISMDCIGAWILNNSKSSRGFQKLIEMHPPLNDPGNFSLLFFQEMASWDSRENRMLGNKKVCCDVFHPDLRTVGWKQKSFNAPWFQSL